MAKTELDRRLQFAINLARRAGDIALEYFRDRGGLVVDMKGAQDWVSEADRNIETFIRNEIAKSFADD